MVRGDKEQKCLNLIKEKIFTNGGQPILHPFTGKTYIEVDDGEFAKEQIWFINSTCHVNYFGLSEENRSEIEQILRNAKSNVKKSEFPDFIFANGFIEHFQVSSSKVNRKGTEHVKKMSQFVSKVNEETEILKQKWNELPSCDEVRSNQWGMDNPEHSHGFLVKSFENNWKKHINSLEKYLGKKDIGIFMIEYSDFALRMEENVYKDWIDGMSQGDMRKQEKIHGYRLTRDKVLLDFVFQYKERIKYVIFVYGDDFEIIRLKNIPYLLKLIPWDYEIYPVTVKNVSSLYNISIPENLSGSK